MCLLTFEDAGRIAGKILLALTFVLVANLVRATGFTEISREISSCGYVRNLQPEIAALVNAQTNSSDKSGLQTNIWRMVFGKSVPNGSTNYMVQIRNLSAVAQYLTSFDACTRDGECWNILSRHFGAMSPLSISEHEKRCKDAYERDLILRFGNGPRIRSSGIRGHLGPNMKIWNETWTRMKSWNAQVGRYRGDLLPLLSKGLRSYMEGLDPIRKAAFQKDFISHAKLSREEIGCLFGN